MSSDEELGALFDEDVDSAVAAAALARIPQRKSDYSSAEFWRRRYALELAANDEPCESFLAPEWYDTSCAALVAAVEAAGVNLRGAVLLQLGCGVSKLAPHLVSAGGAALCVESDIDPVLLAVCQRRAPPHLLYAALDATRLAVRAGVFDCVVEKGTLDALQCSQNGELCQLAVREALRIAPVLISITACSAKLLCTLKGLCTIRTFPVEGSNCFLLVITHVF